MFYPVAKSLHLIGMVSWMAGMFYLVRLMVYHAEAFDRPEPERSILTRQYNIMEWKAYRIIIDPALVITWTFGTIMLCLQPTWLEQAWLQVKLGLLILLSGYTYYCKIHIRRLEAGVGAFSHVGYRAMNEVPTIFLVTIVFLAGLKSGINWIYLIGGVGLFAGLIFYMVRRLNKKTAENDI